MPRSAAFHAATEQPTLIEPHGSENGDTKEAQAAARRTPLAARMRPQSFDEFLGQEHLIGAGHALRRAIEQDRLGSFILWGPPGSGKTTLAELVARQTRSQFIRASAVTAGVADLRRAADDARRTQTAGGRRTILFIDEIHRFNKAQQDTVLPYVESGLLTLIGATTENPSFAVNAALLSRCRVFRLEALSDSAIAELVQRALRDSDRGLATFQIDLTEEALNRLVALADGDARVALNALELATVAASGDEASEQHTIDVKGVEDAMQQPALLYDRAGDMHYQVISAFIKSVRGSDPDAAIYWLARLLEAGEDPLFVSRRMVLLAAEDVGLADPQALPMAMAAHQAVQSIGMPEGYLPLTEATLYLALAPKSNSALTAYANAREDVQRTLNEPVPLHLRNAITSLDRAMGNGRDYRYAHDHAEHYIEQDYLPAALKGQRYFRAGQLGWEASHAERLARLREK